MYMDSTRKRHFSFHFWPISYLAWELDGQSLQLGLRFGAGCDELANVVGILVLVNVVDHCVHNSLALVSEIRQLGTKLNRRNYYIRVFMQRN